MADANAQQKKSKQPSNRLLSMKFMQRSLEKEKQEEIERERKRIITESEWVLEYETEQVQKPKIRVDYQPSYLAFSNVPQTMGRQSFKEFNKVVEKSEQEAAEQLKKDRQSERDKHAEMEEEDVLNDMKKSLQDKRKSKKRRTGGGGAGGGNEDYNTSKSGKKKAKQQEKPPPPPKPQGFIRPE